MKRREFCQSAVCAAVIAALPGEQWTRSWDSCVWKSTHGRIITDEALVETGWHFTELQPWQKEFIAFMERNPHVALSRRYFR